MSKGGFTWESGNRTIDSFVANNVIKIVYDHSHPSKGYAIQNITNLGRNNDIKQKVLECNLLLNKDIAILRYTQLSQFDGQYPNNIKFKDITINSYKSY